MSLALPSTMERSLRILRLQRSFTRRSDPPRAADPSRTMEEIIRRVVTVFEEIDVRWALIGAHAVGMLTEPRATSDVDFVVEESKLRRLVAALKREFGELESRDIGPALRLKALDVDLVRSTTHPLFREALTQVRTVGGWQIPVPEMLMVLKFLAAVSPWRGIAKRTHDIGDLRALFHAVGKDDLDGDLMRRLAAQVYPGAEAEFEQLLGKIERGEPIAI